MDGSVAFLRRRRPRRGMGRHQEGRVCELAPSSPLHKATILPTTHTLAPQTPWAQNLIFLSSGQPLKEEPWKDWTGRAGQSGGSQRLGKAQGVLVDREGDRYEVCGVL